ncbi:MAG TPA: PqqD family peptide modification chaperone [Alphaproteobacteria bacterium]
MLEKVAGGADGPDVSRPGMSRALNADFHVLDDTGLLFDEARQRLYVLDRTAAFVWCQLADGLRPDEAAVRLAAATSLSTETCMSLVDAAIRAWRAHGLLDVAPAAMRTGTAGVSVTDRMPPGAGPRPALARPRRGRPQFYVAGLDVLIRCPAPHVARRVRPVFAHLPAAMAAEPGVVIDVRRGPRGYVIACDGVPVADAAHVAEIAPAVKAALVQAILARADFRLAVHAAAIAADGRVLLIPGPAGAGKTTLAAALMAGGFTLLGDDTVVLEAGDLRVRPLPFAPAVKSGAWELLAPYFPDILDLPIDVRPDRRQVRYLRPARIATEAQPAQWIVFPRAKRHGRTSLEPLSRVEALRRLLTMCYAPARRLGAADVRQLVTWLAGLECYELDASHLGTAVRLLRQICR